MRAHQNYAVIKGCCIAIFAAVLFYSLSAATAQTPRNPFAVGGQEFGGRAAGIMGWILAQQSTLYLMISNAVRAAKQNGSAFWDLAAISFAYGIFHAAGPGHGKAVVAAYMLANERALRRGLLISVLAALLQGFVAVALIGILAVLFHSTARVMNAAAANIDIASFAGIAALGLWLVWSKGTAFITAWHRWRQGQGDALLMATATPYSAAGDTAPFTILRAESRTDPAENGQSGRGLAGPEGRAQQSQALKSRAGAGDTQAMATGAAGHIHDAHCGHFHAPNPATLGADFSWKTALLTLVAAGSRPCAGAILVLVFALSQGIFWAGVGATLAMSLGTAITTAALASLAVLAKNIASRIADSRSTHGELAVRGLELVAALVVCVFGFGLLCGVLEYGA